MLTDKSKVRVLYSFPHKLGADRICNTAWQLVNAASAAGAEMLVFPGAVHRPLPSQIVVSPTLAWGRLRLPYKVLGHLRAIELHDRIVANRLKDLLGQIDVVHAWPLGAKKTLQAARKLGIPSVLERPNAHTAFAYEVVRHECEQLGVSLPSSHEHAFNSEILRREEEEYALADRLLCPSDFVRQTFLDRGFTANKLARHQYGYDPQTFFTNGRARRDSNGLTMLFVGGAAPRKGLHYALEAWLKSPASESGTFSIAGAFIPEYEARLRGLLSHPSIRVLGHRSDVAELMRKSDILVLPSIEEGSALVTSEARASGCVILVSDASGAICTHLENALVHKAGDINTLAEHISMLHNDRSTLNRLRESSLSTVSQITWMEGGKVLLDVYRNVVNCYKKEKHN
jgi:glycosyltransferase involved in cell wall biosynthesis